MEWIYIDALTAISMKCVETDDEPITNSTETFYQLSCFIDKGKADLNFILTNIRIIYFFKCLRIIQFSKLLKSFSSDKN